MCWKTFKHSTKEQSRKMATVTAGKESILKMPLPHFRKAISCFNSIIGTSHLNLKTLGLRAAFQCQPLFLVLVCSCVQVNASKDYKTQGSLSRDLAVQYLAYNKHFSGLFMSPMHKNALNTE